MNKKIMAVVVAVCSCGAGALQADDDVVLQENAPQQEQMLPEEEVLLEEEVIQDFEGIKNTPALLEMISHKKAGAEVELGLDSGVDGGSAMNLSLHTGTAPWFTQVEFDLEPVDLSRVDAVRIYLKRLPDTSNELLEIQLKNGFGSAIVTGEAQKTQSFSTSEFQPYTIDTSAVGGKLARISFNAKCSDGGTANLAVDNIAIRKPEVAAEMDDPGDEAEEAEGDDAEEGGNEE